MKKIFALVIVLSLALSLCSFSGFAADNGEFTITTGAEYVEKVVSANFGSTFIIEGAEDTDGDGEADGIILPSTYQVSGFYGKIIGVDGKNNVLIPGTRSMFSTIGAGETYISNLVLKGDTVKATGTAAHTGALISKIDNAASVVTLDKITNYVNVADNQKTKLNLGGIVGCVLNTGITITNCTNYGTVGASRAYQGVAGILGGSNAATTITISGCKNYGEITYVSGGSSPANQYLGGIYGGTLNGENTIVQEANPINITLCANYGKIYSATKTSFICGGLVGRIYKANISKCFNAGEVTSGGRYAGGIIGRVEQTEKDAVVVSDCFNTGKIMSANNTSGSLTVVESACGIAAVINTGDRDSCAVINCYNVGIMGEKAPLFNEDNKVYYNTITNSDSKSCTNNYQTSAEESDYYITIEELAGGLEELGLSDEIWEYTDTTGANKYSLPQIKGNMFTTDETTWYVEPEIVPEEDVTVAEGTLSFSSADDSTFVPTTSDTKEPITTAYSVVTGRFTLGNGLTENDIEYGMLISKTVSGDDLKAETCTKKAIALKNYNGAYGILFYGNMVTGDTYYVRPYVKYNDVYTYGTATSFVFGE